MADLGDEIITLRDKLIAEADVLREVAWVDGTVHERLNKLRRLIEALNDWLPEKKRKW